VKVLLINPPRWHELVGKNPSIIEKHRGFNPPLGLLYLAACIKNRTPFDVTVLDTQPRNLSYEELAAELRELDADVVGVTAMSFTLIDAIKTVRLAKAVLPKARTVLGGTHVHLFPDETIALDGVDYAFMGEAEFAFVEFLKAFSNGVADRESEGASSIDDMLHGIPGLVYRRPSGSVIKNDFVPIFDLDNVPRPQRCMLDVGAYNSLLSRGALSTILITSRGCPFRCAFCDRPLSPITSKFRVRSAESVLDEIGECVELGIQDILFYDDTFTVDRERVLSICEGILERRYTIRWDMRTRVNLVDATMLALLKRAGCTAVHYGVEAGNDRMLNVIKKGFTVQKVRDVFAMTRKAGIDTLAYFMIGLPTEREEDLADTFALARSLKPDYAHFTIFSPYPGTELYNLGLERGIITSDIWREFARDPQPGFRIPVWEEHFTREQLYKRIVQFYRSFYLRPGYVLKRLTRIRSKAELMRKARAGLSVLGMRACNVDKM
jgi:anaerobic magnesium-protoporphyrin IX monomethyl ester cyclase